MLAMAISWTPSPASLAPTDRGMSGMAGSPKTCRSRLAGDGDFPDAIASKLAPTDSGVLGIVGSRHTCRSRLAGDGDFPGAFAGKPGSYGLGGVPIDCS